MQTQDNNSSNTNAQQALRQKVFERDTAEGAKLKADISLCCWSYPGYPLQLRVTMEGGGTAYIVNKSLTAFTCVEDDIAAMLAGVRLAKCKTSTCNNLAYDPASIDTNRDGMCEACFLAKLNADYQKDLEKEKEDLAKSDADHKSRGFTHRVDAWIHGGGDDKLISIYMVSPTTKQIKDEIRRQGSSVLDDYSLNAL